MGDECNVKGCPGRITYDGSQYVCDTCGAAQEGEGKTYIPSEKKYINLHPLGSAPLDKPIGDRKIGLPSRSVYVKSSPYRKHGEKKEGKEYVHFRRESLKERGEKEFISFQIELGITQEKKLVAEIGATLNQFVSKGVVRGRGNSMLSAGRLFSSASIEAFKNDLKDKNIAQNLDENNTKKINAMKEGEKIDLEFKGHTYIVKKTKDGKLNIYSSRRAVLFAATFAAAQREGRMDIFNRLKAEYPKECDVYFRDYKRLMVGLSRKRLKKKCGATIKRRTEFHPTCLSIDPKWKLTFSNPEKLIPNAELLKIMPTECDPVLARFVIGDAIQICGFFVDRIETRRIVKKEGLYGAAIYTLLSLTGSYPNLVPPKVFAEYYGVSPSIFYKRLGEIKLMLKAKSQTGF